MARSDRLVRCPRGAVNNWHALAGKCPRVQGAVKQAMLNASGRLILPEFLPALLIQATANETPGPLVGRPIDLAALIDRLLQEPGGQLHDKVIAAVGRVLFSKVLRHTHSNQGKTTELLGPDQPCDIVYESSGLVMDKVPVSAPQKRPQGGDAAGG